MRKEIRKSSKVMRSELEPFGNQAVYTGWPKKVSHYD